MGPGRRSHGPAWATLLTAILLPPGCTVQKSQSVALRDAPTPSASPGEPVPHPSTTEPAALASAAPPVIPPDPVLPPGAEFVSVERHWASLKRICALTPFGGSLYAAHAYGALSIDGATVTRYTPGETPAITVAFDWNRRGQPTKGGGAGQGFLRLRELDGRLYLPDADPPYVGFGLSGKGIEGYVFVSDTAGRFARSRYPNHLPPAPPTADRAGAAVLPYAYHVFDVARLDSHVYASGGAAVRGGGAPGALFLAGDDEGSWLPVALFPDPPGPHVWRLTYLSTFRHRLYAGVETFYERSATDYVSFTPSEDGRPLASTDATAAENALPGGASTLRWRNDAARLYWIAAHAGGVTLQFSEDGMTWQRLDLPDDAGRPLDLVRFRGALVILTEHRLLQLRGEQLLEVARFDSSSFTLGDAYCPAPLAVLGEELYAGGQQQGRLFRLTWPAPPPAPPGRPAHAQSPEAAAPPPP